ncbi:MAG: hypothetical protein M3340_02645, partial [Actinomycetota bacterium]|nr:hypothetical protein [Actinomycetota bacterium]
LGPLGGAGPGGAPEAGAGAFVLERAGRADDPGSTVYLTFAGDWAIDVVDGGDDRSELLCGVNGLERLSFRPYVSGGAFDRLRFVPGRAAYAPRFPFAEASIARLAGAGELLDDTHRTAWATVVPGDASEIAYLAQPASSPLYEVAPAAAEGDTTIFDWLSTSTPLPSAVGFALPFAPYAGVDAAAARFPAGELPLFETQVLAPARKELVKPSALARLRNARAARAAGAASEGSTTATTPQGFVVTLEGESYGTVTLARSSGPDLALEDVTPELQNLLQTNQLFAVLVDPANLGAFADSVTMSQWELAAPVGGGSTATDYRNVLILKFVEGTLEDRVRTPEKWIDAAEFSLLPSESGTPADVRLSGLSQWLSDYVAAALAEADAGNTLYADFATVARDPRWNGFLVLRANVTGLPSQLQGLMAGIDVAQLNAHHFGATVTPVTPGTSGPTLGPSSLFGLIDYQLPDYRRSVASGGGPDLPIGLPVAGAYGFSVLQLQALFRNAALVDFRSRIQLTANELFGSAVSAAYGSIGQAPATGVVLRGSYQSQGGKDAYVFEQDATTVFTLDDGVLPAVAVTRAQFDTLGETGSGAAATTVSRFLMWGALDFAELVDGAGSSFDALSFGSATGTPPASLGTGLAFSNLKIDMAFPTATPQATTFAFDASGLAFDLATSSPREGSAFQSLELQLDSFLAAPAGKRPSDYGYLPVGSQLNTAPFDGPWYAVVYKLTLGSPGALVATAGFESRLLVGWAPGGASYSVVTGILLPGAAPGAKLFSLQGVLKLSIASVQLLRQEVAGNPGREAFVIRLRGMGLKFLGVAKLPPGATIDLFLFGALEDGGSLGWYAGYRK